MFDRFVRKLISQYTNTAAESFAKYKVVYFAHYNFVLEIFRKIQGEKFRILQFSIRNISQDTSFKLSRGIRTQVITQCTKSAQSIEISVT